MLAARDPHLDPPPFRGRTEKPSSSWVLDALCRTTGWHRKHAVRALRRRVLDKAVEIQPPRKRKRRYGAAIKDALTALWEASDRVCGKRLAVMIPPYCRHWCNMAGWSSAKASRRNCSL